MTEYTNHRGCPAYPEAWTRYAWPVVAQHLGVEAASALSGQDAVDKALKLLGMAGNSQFDQYDALKDAGEAVAEDVRMALIEAQLTQLLAR